MINDSGLLPEISIVVPLYNEEDGFEELCTRLVSLNDQLPFKIEVVLVNDGSRDSTPLLMDNLASNNPLFTSVFLSRNHGHQLAVSAGIKVASGTKGIFIIDGDLQDPPELLLNFYELLKDGYDVVYGIRKKRKEGSLKKFAYWAYYRLLKSIANTDINLDSGDYSLISRRVADLMIQMPEQSRYLRGMRSWIGYKQYGYEYERHARHAGNTKYSLKKLVELAYNGIFNFSDFPIKAIARLGIFTLVSGIIYSSYIVFRKYYFGDVPQGFTSQIIIMTFFTGAQLTALGIIGEYVIRIFKQVQNRPLFIIDRVVKIQSFENRTG
jgi:glycosyltransferase involved in cell wall biosynthesis